MAPLRGLVDAGHDIALVVSRADRRRGRNAEPTPSPVKAAALAAGLAVTDRVDDAVTTVRPPAELGIVVAYGRLIKPPVLGAFPMVNVHFSLLPRWRGAAPVERAILAGDAQTGVCLMALEEGLDTGGVYARRAVPIGSEELAEDLRARLVTIGTTMLIELLAGGPAALGEPEPQVGEPTYAAKILAEDLRLDWHRPAVELERIPRVGKAWTEFRGRRLLVLRARAVPGPAASAAPAAGGALPPGVLDGLVVGTGEGGLELLEVQVEGRAAQPASAWRNGARPAPGELLGSP